MQTAGVAFDRAVGYYDQTRALPDEVMGEMTRMLLGELDGCGRCLEVAIGTGRMAIPLAEAGVPMYGVDLSFPMLENYAEVTSFRSHAPAQRSCRSAMDHLVPPWPVWRFMSFQIGGWW